MKAVVLQKVFESLAWFFAILTVVGWLATGFLFAVEVWVGVAVYGTLTILYGYLAFSLWVEGSAGKLEADRRFSSLGGIWLLGDDSQCVLRLSV